MTNAQDPWAHMCVHHIITNCTTHCVRWGNDPNKVNPHDYDKAWKTNHLPQIIIRLWEKITYLYELVIRQLHSFNFAVEYWSRCSNWDFNWKTYAQSNGNQMCNKQLLTKYIETGSAMKVSSFLSIGHK